MGTYQKNMDLWHREKHQIWSSLSPKRNVQAKIYELITIQSHKRCNFVRVEGGGLMNKKAKYQKINCSQKTASILQLLKVLQTLNQILGSWLWALDYLLSEIRALYIFKQKNDMFPSTSYLFPMQMNNQMPFSLQQARMNAFEIQKLTTAIQLMMDKEEKMIKQVQKLRNQLQTVKKTMDQTIACTIKEEMSRFVEKMEKNYQQANCLKKDRKCIFEGCNRLYSSQTALRAHIRSKHYPQEQTSEDFQPLFP